MNPLMLVEIQRLKGRPQAIQTIAFAAITSFLVCIYLLYDISDPELLKPTLLSNFAILLALVLGMAVSVTVISGFGSDTSSGIISSYLSYPLPPRTIILSKWVARFLFILPSIILPFLLMVPLIPHMGMKDCLLIVLYIIVLSFLIFTVTIACSTMIRHRPVPEILAIIYVLAITIFRDAIPVPRPYVYALDPLSYIKSLLSGSTIALEDTVFTVLSLVLYSLLLFISLAAMDRMEWGMGDAL